MSDRCELRKRNVSQGFQHLASMTDSDFESEFRKFLAKNNVSVSSLPAIDKSAIGKQDGGKHRRKMKASAGCDSNIFIVPQQWEQERMD